MGLTLEKADGLKEGCITARYPEPKQYSVLCIFHAAAFISVVHEDHKVAEWPIRYVHVTYLMNKTQANRIHYKIMTFYCTINNSS